MQRSCDVCDEAFEAKRASARYCSERCKKRHQRGARKKARAPVTELPAAPAYGPAETAARAELAEVGRLDTLRGQAVLALARRLDNPDRETGAGLASIAKQLEAAMVSATDGVKIEDDPLDELRAARERKRRAAAG